MGTYTIQRRDDAAEYMIGSTKLLGTFQGNDITDIFYYANNVLLAHGIGTDGADVGISHIMTALAEFDLAAHAAHYFAEMLHIGSIFLEQMKHQAEGGFFTNPGQFSKLVDRIFQQGRRELHSQQMY